MFSTIDCKILILMLIMTTHPIIKQNFVYNFSCHSVQYVFSFVTINSVLIFKQLFSFQTVFHYSYNCFTTVSHVHCTDRPDMRSNSFHWYLWWIKNIIIIFPIILCNTRIIVSSKWRPFPAMDDLPIKYR